MTVDRATKRGPLLARKAVALPSSEALPYAYSDRRMLNLTMGKGLVAHEDLGLPTAASTLRTKVNRETTDDA